MAKVFHRLVTVEEAARTLEDYLKARRPGVEEVALEEAYGRILAEDVLASYDYPPFDRSEVDGYAVRSTDLVGADEDNPIGLRLLGYVGVGREPGYVVDPGTCVEVATGSMIPRGADAVVPVEYTRRAGDLVYVYRSVAPGENVVHGGYDVLAGDVVTPEGTLLGPVEIAVLAGVGVSRVRVYRRIRAGVVSVGSELVRPGEALRPGVVFDANSYYLQAALRELGLEVVAYGIVGDREEELEAVLRKALGECDLVIVSGGTSAGVGDLTYRVVERLGSPGILFHGLKVRPGKPTFVALIGDKLVIGLPGFPLSMMMIFNILVKPLLAKLTGLREGYSAYRENAILSDKVVGYIGVDRLVPVVLRRKSGNLVAYPMTYRSGSMNVLQVADGFVRVGAGVPYLDPGSRVEVHKLHNLGIADVLVVGSHDYLLSAVLRRIGRGLTSKYVPTGSIAGLEAVAKGIADAAGVHILDRDSGTYNVATIKKLGYGDRVALVIGYAREVGLVTARGNPKGIRDLRDLLREDIVFVNRSRYSGIRVLVDSYIEDLARELGVSFGELVGRIRGYFSEAKTHSGVAINILTGRADVGLTLRYVALRYGLDFIPLTRERFDIAVSLDSLENPGVRRLIDFLGSAEFRRMLADYPGYEALSETGELVILK